MIYSDGTGAWAGVRMSRRSEPPEAAPTPGRRGPGRSWDPFYQFEQLARDDGKPCAPPEPKAELRLLAMLGTKTAVTVMYCLLVIVVGVVLGLLVAARM
jgi:hypothetical protein